MKVCQLCSEEGHYSGDCPDDPNKQTLFPFPNLSDENYKILIKRTIKESKTHGQDKQER